MEIKIKVITGAKKAEITEEKGSLKVKLKSRPIKGKANEELIKLLAKKYAVSKSQIEIIKGLTSKNKLVKI
jgi:uncharacterized protein